ncbi:MAG: PaaI family thioesterase [Myxococcales bacterium]|nr:PaaI family thioesterase [Myxococcales bacterium]
MSPPVVTTPDQLRALGQLLKLPPHNKFLGIDLESVEDMMITTSIPVREEFVGDVHNGLLHGGVVTAMLDATCGLAVMVKLGKLTRIATLDLRIDYLKPATDEFTLYSRCSCYKLTQQIAFVQGTAFTRDEDSNEDEIAKATGTFMIINQQRVPS